MMESNTKKKINLLNLRLLFFISMLFSLTNIFGQSYDDLWKEVAKYRKEYQPQSALKKLDAIIEKAEKGHDFPQLTQAQFVKLSLNEELDPDSLKGDIDKMEQRLPTTKDPVQRAMLCVLLATTYEGFESYYNIRDVDTIEKSGNRKKELLDSALVDMRALADACADDYQPLTTLHDDSKHFFGHDVLSLITSIVLGYNGLDFSYQKDILDRVMTFYRQEGRNTEASLVELKRIQIESRKLSIYQAHIEGNKHHDRYVEMEQRLKQMYAETKDVELIADIDILLHDYFVHGKQEKHDFLIHAIAETKGTRRSKYLQQELDKLLKPHAQISMSTFHSPSDSIPITINYTNVDQVTLVIRNKSGKKVVERELRYNKSIHTQNDTIYVSLEADTYEVNLQGNFAKNDNPIELRVSTIALATVGDPKDNTTIVHVVDNTTGAPVPQSKVERTFKAGRWYRSEASDKKETVVTDNRGIAYFKRPDSKDYRYQSLVAYRTPNDISLPVESYFTVEKAKPYNEVETIYRIFTDRSIYRPGQSVHASVIAFNKQGDKIKVREGRKCSLILRDANYRNVDSVEITTDAYGVASGDLVIPADNSVLGRYTIELANSSSSVFNNSSTSIKVEEYKRPTFHTEMKTYEDIYRFGDTIQAQGVATLFSGAPIQNATVDYTIETCKSSPWRLWGLDWREQVSDEVETDENGIFNIPVYFNPANKEAILDEDEYDLLFNDNCVMYRVTAHVTNLAGETRSCSTTFHLSDKEFFLSADVKSTYDKSKGKAEVSINASNPKGKPLERSGEYHIVCATDTAKVIVSGTFVSGQSFSLPYDKMPAGEYIIKMNSSDSKGETIYGQSKSFVVFSPKEKDMNLTKDWLYCESPIISPTKSARVYFAPKEKGTLFLHYYLKSEKEIIEYRPIDGEAGLNTFDIKYKEEYADGLTLLIFYMKDGLMHSETAQLTLQKPEKKLKLEWATFRDHLRPGQEEEWILNIKHQDGKPADAHLIAAMYDASLDQLYGHSWNLGIHFYRSLTDFTTYNSCSYSRNTLTLTTRINPLYPESYQREFDNLLFLGEFSDIESLRYFDITSSNNTFNFNRRRYNHTRSVLYKMEDDMIFEHPKELHSVAIGTENSAIAFGSQKAVKQESLSPSIEEVDDKEMEEDSATDISNVEMRSDFAETAFFQPNLLTDKDGNVSISFHLPESLTEWKFMALANTKDMDHGYITARATAQKDFMVQPNMPRFLRDGDKAKIATSVINLTDDAINGTATMLITDAETGEELKRQDVPFNLEAKATAKVVFDYEADIAHPLLVCKIVGVAGGTSDGEQNYLPIIDSRQRILETIPFYIEQGSKDIDVNLPKNTFTEGSTDRMTLEYTDTPAWTVIQAIQTLATPNEEDAFSYSTSLYTNAIAQHFADRMPAIQTVIETWKNEASDQLTSPLQQNEELRNIIQREAPWMLDADKESAERERLVELFDRPLLQKRIKVALKKLREMQFNNGAWPWFNGMIASSWTTLTVTEHLAALHTRGLLNNEATRMMHKAIDWLGGVTEERYFEMLKHTKNPQPSEFDLHYLYISYITNHKHSEELEKIHKVYLDYVEKNMKRDFTIYGWAQTALLLEAAGREKSAIGLMKSIREYSVLTPGQGRHYNTERAYYSWRDYKIPTQIAAMRAMKRYSAHFSDTDSYLHDMQLWLISQKQTQAWDNPLNTVDAVDVLLGSKEEQEELFHDPQRPVVTINDKDVDMGEMTPALGYFKTVVPNSDIKTNNTLKVTKQTPGTSWGAVYVQYTAKSEDVQDVGKELKVTRRYLVESKNADGTSTLRDLKKGEVLQIGQKVTVRLTVTADRDMDFVSLRCQRAACFEPLEQLSGYSYKTGQGYYRSVHDSSTDYFFDVFRRGTLTLDMNLVVARSGHYIDGLANVQCAYAPSFAGHSKGTAVDVK